jgi:hypothetical protein
LSGQHALWNDARWVCAPLPSADRHWTGATQVLACLS